jgi:hypothetical protein
MKDRKEAIAKANEALVELNAQLNTLQFESNSNQASIVTISNLMLSQIKKIVDILVPTLETNNLKRITDLLSSKLDIVAYYNNLVELNEVDLNRLQSIRSQHNYNGFEAELKSIYADIDELSTESQRKSTLITMQQNYPNYELVLLAAGSKNWMKGLINRMTGKTAKVQEFLDTYEFKSIEDFENKSQEDYARIQIIKKTIQDITIRSGNIKAIQANEKRLTAQTTQFELDKESKVKDYIASTIETMPDLTDFRSLLVDDNRVIVSSIIAFRKKLEILRLSKITLNDEIADRKKCIKSINDSLKKWKQSTSKTLQQDQTNRLVNSPILRRRRTNAIHASTSKLRSRVDDFNDYDFYDLTLEADSILPFWVLLFPEQDFINPLMLKNLVPNFDPDIIEFPNYDNDDSQFDSPQDSPPDDYLTIDFDWSQPIDSSMDNVSDNFVGSNYGNESTSYTDTSPSVTDVSSWFDSSPSVDTSSYGGMD